MPKIVLDFDHTLFNAEAFKRDLAKSLGLTKAQWDKQYQANLKKYKYYHYQKHLANFSPAKQNKFLKVVENSKKYLYPDSLDFLKKIAKHKPVLLTWGFPAFQKLKVHHCGLEKYLRIQATSKDKTKFFQSGNLFFINDNGLEIDAVKKKFPQVISVWVRRSNGKYRNTPCKLFDYKITNLKKLCLPLTN